MSDDIQDSVMWTEVEPHLREQALAVINNDPNVLLERDGGPMGERADVILAWLLGFDDQVDQELRLSRLVDVLEIPIPERLTMVVEDDMPYSSMRTATYKLQSSYAKARITAEMAPPDTTPGPDFMVDILFVRYRRRS